MDFFTLPFALTPAYRALQAAWQCEEGPQVMRLLATASQTPEAMARIKITAHALVSHVRSKRRDGNGIDALMHEYQLSTPEGVVLMCLAEALLRIPDEDTADKLIRDKLLKEDWASHLGNSESLFVNASTFGLMMSGRMLRAEESLDQQGHRIFSALLQRSSEPLIRNMLRHAMRILGKQFVMGRTIREALKRAEELEAEGFRYSYDMLGEAAHTREDSTRYLQAYLDAIAAMGKAARGRGPQAAPGISIKLSALHPRYEFAQASQVLAELYPALLQLGEAAKAVDIGLTIDAEESERLELSLILFERLALESRLQGWQGLGLAVQAYQKRAFDLIGWLEELATTSQRQLMVRLVKGAYWDSEIKRAQERGVVGYPVFTRKGNTDVSYLACAKRLLASPVRFFPQFATHNAHTVATILSMARESGNKAGFEFQRLHGMGTALYDRVMQDTRIACRIYAPVGSHEDLLPYLVRRLLENGANSSFVNRIADDATPIDTIIADPREQLALLATIPHPRIPLPGALFADRRNSQGLNLSDAAVLLPLQLAMQAVGQQTWFAAPLVAGTVEPGAQRPVLNPADTRQHIGKVQDATVAQVSSAIATASEYFTVWNNTPAEHRAACLDTAANLLEARMPMFLVLCQQEAGKTLADGLSEVREAVDFLRYYANAARQAFTPVTLPGPTGEQNILGREGRGVFACISPWNFPLAIFTGQIAAALVAGNTVLAKPAEQTPLIAAATVKLLHEAGIPVPALQLLPGPGETIGAALVSDPRVSGVVFTGGIDTALRINRSLAGREGPIATLIAETGGLNAMLVDSSALKEQVASDVLASAFQSAGQRCSALRILLVQEDIADDLLHLLEGAMAELVIGDPANLATDVGPVIDNDALQSLQAYAGSMSGKARLIYRCTLPATTSCGTFFAPQAWELPSLDLLEREVFGPVLHVVRYRADQLENVLAQLNARGYGLTFGIQSRIDSTIALAQRTIRAGNVYVNRNMIGAVVGVHPFGGLGLSGTGPKAGGPEYLLRFTVEKTVSTNTTAAGGNASLMTLDDG